MSAPVTIAAKGTTIARGGAIANVTSIKGAGVEVSKRNTTHLGSTWKTKEPNLPEASDVTIEANYTPAGHAAIVAEAAAGTKTSTVIAFPADTSGGTSGSITFLAFVSKVEFNGIQEDGTVSLSVVYTPVESVTVAGGS